MSCVVGLVDRKKVYLGSDGIATDIDGECRPINIPKIFKRGSFIIGFTGSIRTGQIIQRSRYRIPTSIWGWPDLIREQTTKKGAMVISDENGEVIGSNFIIGHKGKLYELLCDFQLNEVNGFGYTAIGAGSTPALGSLFTSENFDFLGPDERIRMALEAASEFSKSCGPPYTIKVLK